MQWSSIKFRKDSWGEIFLHVAKARQLKNEGLQESGLRILNFLPHFLFCEIFTQYAVWM